ncbi:hypothetical protein FGADI_26 [Fusarium gaditjirri]|uniref:Uncharacterized protein n=1 Tax=Fusarium gaditjirri TaxID=282569 RepID=A0A8H4TPC5_9HYPO|nr:hypothetical protein FGADI_26 [Fusarium gaditjirri]
MTPPLDQLEPITVLIGFRVECHDHMPRYASQQQIQLETNSRSSLTTECNTPDNQQGLIEAAANHLSWKQVSSPFASLFRSWESDLRLRDQMIKKGAFEVLIIAIWLRNRVVYDAENIAKSLGYVECPATPDEETRPLHRHVDEILITGGILASGNMILASFGGGNRNIKTMLISPLINDKRELLPAMMSTEVEMKYDIGEVEITERLAFELFHRTGVLDDGQFCALVLVICGYPVRTRMTENGVLH